jgi:N-acyl-D-amino-acid deacylase
MIFDGSGQPPVTGDVLLENGRIAAVGERLEVPAAAEVVDCRGLAIAPGFIDLHSHSDLQVLENRTEKTLQGVTTEVVGNCGFSPYPCGDHAPDLREFANGIFRGDDRWAYATASDYFAAVERSAGHSVHSLIGHGSLRVASFGQRQGPLEASELDTLDGELRTALSAGAAGLSTGLMYAPGSSAPFEELERLCQSVARAGKLYATHMRSYSFELLESVEEQLALARATGCRLQISHLQAVGQANWDKQRRALDAIEAAAREGIDVEFDIYPYRAGSTVMTQLLPQWALEGGTDRMISRLRDTTERRRIAEEAVSSMAQRWRDIFVTSVRSGLNQRLVGQHLDEIAARLGVDPIDAAIDLIIQEEGAVNIVSFNQSEENLRELLTHPLCSVISDGFYVNGRPHPRLHGTFPFLLGQIARDEKWMPLESAIHKITEKPAARLGLRDRGRIATGLRADLVVFDPAVISSPATYENPEQDPVGVVAVYRATRA